MKITIIIEGASEELMNRLYDDPILKGVGATIKVVKPKKSKRRKRLTHMFIDRM